MDTPTTYARDGGATDVIDDPKARELLRGAFEKTSRWPKGFGGFDADLLINVNGTETAGTLAVASAKEVTVSLPDEDLQKWAQGQISMMATHRGPRTFDESDGQYHLAFGGEERHPQGPRIRLGDAMGSSYRVKDHRITQISRTTPRIAFTINIEDSAKTQDGTYLTTRYTVYYYSPTDGALTNVDSFTDTHTRVGNADLPATRRVISYENGAVVTRSIIFSNHRIR